MTVIITNIFENSEIQISKEKEMLPFGESYKFLGAFYLGNSEVKLQVGDEVIIHPIEGVSQAEKSYPAIITSTKMDWVKGEYPNHTPAPALELSVKGIRENSGWYGAIINDYCFSRLEFVKRSDGE